MHDTPAVVDLSDPVYAGIVVMRPHAGEERGVLLLNVAETQARIRFLPGFRSASFLVDSQGAIVAEYLQWRSAEHVGAAFKKPEFFEHLAIVEKMAAHPTVAFGAPAAVLTDQGETRFALEHRRYALTVLQVQDGSFDRALRHTVDWARSLVGTSVAAAAVHGDDNSVQIGVLLAGGFDSAPPPELEEHGLSVVEHLGALHLYASVVPGENPEAALHYSMILRG